MSHLKQTLKQVKGSLRGLVLQVCNEKSVHPYTTLSEFGKALLAEESKGNMVEVTQVWTATGIERINSLDQFTATLRSKKVRAIQFVSTNPNERVNWGD